MEIINAFPGYEYVNGKNMYRGIDVSRGGYVYGKPGIYENVAMLDVQSEHPHSAIAMNYFGDYTPRFKDLVDARIAIKNGRLEDAGKMLNGALKEFLDPSDPEALEALAYALKIAINSVYGLTSAKFNNPFHDPRNVNNIVALRGALFMKTLQDEIAAKGYIVVAIRTDSIKIADADPSIIDFGMEFAKKYGYSFDFETVYDRIALANDAAYIAKYMDGESCKKIYGVIPKDNRKHGGEWTATAAQFQQPYVFKKLFSHEEIVFKDICEVKEVKSGALYLDMNEELPEGEHNYVFVGRIGNFVPVKPGTGGGELLVLRDGKYVSASGGKGYRWRDAETVRGTALEETVDLTYHNSLVDKAIDAIDKYGDFEQFVGEREYISKEDLS